MKLGLCVCVTSKLKQNENIQLPIKPRIVSYRFTTASENPLPSLVVRRQFYRRKWTENGGKKQIIRSFAAHVFWENEINFSMSWKFLVVLFSVISNNNTAQRSNKCEKQIS
jgi:hypothetical protein